MDSWHKQKDINYSDLRCDIEAKGWKVHALYVKVGTTGHDPFQRMCDVLGFNKVQVSVERGYAMACESLTLTLTLTLTVIPP